MLYKCHAFVLKECYDSLNNLSQQNKTSGRNDEKMQLVTLAPWIDTSESKGSKRGQPYLSAPGDRIPNFGEKKLRVVTEEGNEATATFQMVNVTRPLCSVSKVCDKGNRFIFEAHGGYVELYDGSRT